MDSGHSSLPSCTGPPLLWLPRHRARLALSCLTGRPFSVLFCLPFLCLTAQRSSASALSPRPAPLRITLSLGGIIQYVTSDSICMLITPSIYIYICFSLKLSQNSRFIYSVFPLDVQEASRIIGPKWNTRFPYQDCFFLVFFSIFVSIHIPDSLFLLLPPPPFLPLLLLFSSSSFFSFPSSFLSPCSIFENPLTFLVI